MATQRWIGAAPAAAQVNTITVGGTPNTAQVYAVSMNGKTVAYAALVSDTNTTIATALQALLAASTIPEFTEVVWTNPGAGVVVGTAATPGYPFTSTSSATGAGTLTTQAGIATPTISSTSTATSGGALLDTTEYFYKLTALNACGETAASAEVNRTTGNSGSNVNTITINWSAPAGTGITGYKIYRSATTNTEVYLATVGVVTSFLDVGAAAGTTPAPSVNTTVNCGPNDVSTPANWSTGSVPVSSDTVYIDLSSVSLLYNLGALSGVTLTSLNVAASFAGAIGLPETNANGYEEYRQRYLQVGATTCLLGYGEGDGATTLNLDFGSVQTACVVEQTGTSDVNGLETAQLKGSHASNVFTVNRGTVAIAGYGSDAGQHASVLNVNYVTDQNGDATVRTGAGLAVTTLNANGGTTTCWNAPTTLNQEGGTVTLQNGNATTIIVDAGTLFYTGVGTLTTITVGNQGTVDFTQDPRSRTITNAVNMYSGATWNDPFGTCGDNAFALVRCRPADVNLVISVGHTITLS